MCVSARAPTFALRGGNVVYSEGAVIALRYTAAAGGAALLSGIYCYFRFDVWLWAG